MKRRVFRILSIVMVLILLCNCNAEQEDFYPENYTDYRDIPGVTEEEIQAIEAVKAGRDRFVYAQVYSTEGFLLDDGTVAGFSKNLCDFLSQLFGIPFEIQFVDWVDMLNGLDDHTLDFCGELKITPERREKYYMADNLIGRGLTVVRLRNDLTLKDIASFRTLRYAFIEDAVTYDLAMQVSEYPFEAFFVQNYDEAAALLYDKKVDAFFTGSQAIAGFDLYDEIEFTDFFPFIYDQLAFSTGNPELEPMISVMEKYIGSGGYKHLVELAVEGHQDYLRQKLSLRLTPEEKLYLDSLLGGGTPIPYAAEYDNYPISFYNEQEQQWQGIAIDILSEISHFTGIAFEPANPSQTEWPVLLDMLESGEVKLISNLPRSADGRIPFLWGKEPYHEDYYALISLLGTKNIEIREVTTNRIGLVAGADYTDIFFEWFPENLDTVTFANVDDAFDALEKGEIDLFMGTRNLLLKYTNYKERSGYKANLVFDKTYDSTFGFHGDEEVLCSIISKAQRIVDTDSIADSWSSRVFDYNAKLSGQKNSYFTVCVVLLLIILALMFILLRKHRQMSRELEKTVRQRTADLEVQTQAAQAASQAKGEFLARMSHEIRTPLNAIIGMTDIGMAAAAQEKKHSCLQKIEAASNQLLGIINDILDMSKIEANKLEIVVQEMDLEQTLINVTNVVQFRVEEKQQTFIVEIDKNIPVKIMGDELRLTQIITNLLANAVKFTQEGGTIRLRVLVEKQEGGRFDLYFEICDNGIGISQEDQKRLFQSFEQADGGIARKYGGTGLGLSICKRLVELMGGRIWVESEPGNGSKFIFTLQCEQGSASSKPRLHPGINKEQLHVLVADDSPEVRTYFLDLMNASGVSCDVAADGSEALELFTNALQRHPYNIVFADWQMPAMDGIELTKRIKAMDKDTAVILISSANPEDIEKQARKAGINKILSKPVFPSMLMNAVNESFGLSSLEKQRQRGELSFDFRNKRILLAEDVPINREIVITALEDTGVEIDEAENGAVAFEKFSANPAGFDVILMDIHMPDMDGYETTRKIRQLETPKAKAIPIIAMTANVFQEDIDKCLAAGMNDHIGKPMKIVALREKLSIYLASSGQMVPADSAQQPPENARREIPYIDWDEAMDITGGDEQMYTKLLANFQGKQLLDELLLSIEQQDAQRIRLSAHALKGAAANLAFKQLYQITFQMEQLADEGQSVAHLKDELEKIYRTTMDQSKEIR